MKRMVVLGSTGSIGAQTLDLVGRLGERFEVAGLGAGHWSPALVDQVHRWQPRAVAVARSEGGDHGFGGRLFRGPDALEALVEALSPEVVVVGTPGLVGLGACLAALRQGATVLLANKEALVSAGSVVASAARAHGGTIVPVDSEHSGIWQCLRGEPRTAIRRLVLTSSGGALRDVPLAELPRATPADALNHPTWSMGAKITVDSATLMNKGLEVIEASWLFGVPPSRVAVVLHRQSVVHGLVEFADGSIKAQLSWPDMRLAILYGLSYPERPEVDLPRLDLLAAGPLTFEEVDEVRYPALPLARQAAAAGATYPAVLNAANEVAVERFLQGDIRFTDIVPLVRETLGRHQPADDLGLEPVLAADQWARQTCADLLSRRSSPVAGRSRA